MIFDYQWLLVALPVAFALGWLASRLDLRQTRREDRAAPRAYFKGLNLLLNEQQDKAIDAFIEAVQDDPDTSDLHFALGNLFRRRGEYERAVRVHQHLLARADLPRAERERAQYALAQDFLKAGLFDRAEESFQSLEGTDFTLEARLALLGLYERTREWGRAIEVARRLDSSGAGSFATRMAHHWCEIALQADARGQADEALAALTRAREAAPQAPRPLILLGQRLARSGDHAKALAVWDELMATAPGVFTLVAADYVNSAVQAGQSSQALGKLEALYQRAPGVDILFAMTQLQPPGQARRARMLAHLQQHPSLSAALGLLHERQHSEQPLSTDELNQIQQSITLAAKPQQRYRCAACGFEAQHYFWQCPGCQSWDTYPPRRVEDQ